MALESPHTISEQGRKDGDAIDRSTLFPVSSFAGNRKAAVIGQSIGGMLNRKRRHLFLLLPMAVATGLSFYSLGAKDLWLDEAMSVTFARLDWANMWRVIRTNEANMVLYHMLLHPWLRFGTSEFAVRSLSAILAILSIIPVYAIGARLFGSNTGILASLFLSVNAFFIRYAQEARSYALFLLLAAVASYLFLRALDKPSAKSWGLYILAGTLSMYAHFFGAWLIVAHFVSATVFPGKAAWRREVILSHALIGLLVSPLLLPILTPNSHSSHIGWVAKPSLETLAKFFGTLSGFGRPVLVIAYCAAFGYALFSAWIWRPRDALKIWSFVFLINWLCLPVIGSFLFSILFKPIFVARYLILSLPAFVLIAAASLQNLRPAWLKWAAVPLLLALSTEGLRDWYTGRGAFEKETSRAATEYLLANSQASDGVLFEQAFSRMPFEYYLQELRPRTLLAKPLWPSPPWGKFDNTSWGPWPRIEQQRYPRLWRILFYKARSIADSRWLPPNANGEYCLVHRESFPFIQVILYQTCPEITR